jgi:hypothetical protein
MQDSSTAPTTILQFRQDIQARLREGVREAIEATLDEELTAALGSVPSRANGRAPRLSARRDRPEERRTLAFRDFLREHGDVAREYVTSRNIWRLWSTPRNFRHEKRTRTLRASLSTA